MVGLAAVTFLCETSWKNSIVFFESLNISESSLQNIKKKKVHRVGTKTIGSPKIRVFYLK